MDVHLGDVVRLRKPHPCGSQEWEILRLGMDIRLRCCRCRHVVLVPRRKFERALMGVTKPCLSRAAERPPEVRPGPG